MFSTFTGSSLHNSWLHPRFCLGSFSEVFRNGYLVYDRIMNDYVNNLAIFFLNLRSTLEWTYTYTSCIIFKYILEKWVYYARRSYNIYFELLKISLAKPKHNAQNVDIDPLPDVRVLVQDVFRKKSTSRSYTFSYCCTTIVRVLRIQFPYKSIVRRVDGLAVDDLDLSTAILYVLHARRRWFWSFEWWFPPERRR